MYYNFSVKEGDVMADFIFTINAVLPIILVVALGYILKRMKFLNKDFLKVSNKLVFKVLLPVMLFLNIYNVSNLNEIRLDIVLFAALGIVALFLIGLLIVILFIKDPMQKGVVLQCVFRSNYAIIGIPLATMLFGESAAVVASLVSAISIPIFNILAVVSLTVFIKDDVEKKDFKTQAKSILIKIIKNPLILGVVAGIIALLIREVFVINDITFRLSTDLKFVYTALTWLKNTATPLALIVLGGQFEFSAVKRLKKEIAIGTISRIVLAPALMIGIALLFFKDFDGACFACLVALFGSPVAVSSAIMASEMKNDEELAGQLVVWTTLLSSVTIFVLVLILKSINIF